MGLLSKWRARRAARRAARDSSTSTSTTSTATSSTSPIYIGGGTGITSGGAVSMADPSPTPTSSGGGGTYYSGSGTYVSSSGQGYSMATTPTGATISSGVDPNLATTSTIMGGISSQPTPSEMIVQAGGGVRVGTSEYIGKAVVPYTKGKTANQLRAEMQRKATAKGYGGRGRWSATIPITSADQQDQQFEAGQRSAGEFLFGGGEGTPQPLLIPIEEGGSLYQQPVETGTKGFFKRAKARGKERYELVKESSQDISGTYGGTYIPPSPYGSYARGFVQEIPSSFPKVKTAGQDIKQFFQPQIKTAKIGLGIIGMGTKEIGKTPAYQKAKEWHIPRAKAVTSSKEFDILTKTVVRGTAFSPTAIVGRQAFVETIPLSQRQKTFAIEKGEIQIIKGKPYRQSDYTIYTEKQPLRLRIKRKMYEAPTDITYLPSIKTTTRTPYGASIKDSFITLEMKGGRVGSLSRVEGTSQAISRAEILSYQKLPAPKKLLVQRLAKAKTGTYVSPEYIPKILTEKDMRFFSQIDIKALGKARLTPSGIKLEPIKPIRIGTQRKPFRLYGESKYSSPLGKTKTRYEAITETKLVKETDLYALRKSKVLFKDTTLPHARATGKTPELIVFEVEDKIPKIMDDFTGVQILKPADIKKTSLAQTFQVQVPKQPTIFVPPKVPKAIPRTKILPSSRTEQVVPVSAFYGKGMYERTTGGQLPSTQLTPIISPSYTQPLTRTYTPSVASMKEFTIVKSVPSMRIKSHTRGMTKPMSKEIVKEITKPALKEVTKLIQKPSQKLILKQAQKTIPKPRSFFPVTPIKTITPKKPPKIIPPIKRRGKQPKSLFGDYKVYGRRFGKWKVVGKAKDPLSAVGIGKQWASKTLGASFKVPSYKGSDVLGFRTKKEKGELIFIEPKRKRIKRGTKEIPELQYWKGIKSPPKVSKRKFLFFKKKDGKYGFI